MGYYLTFQGIGFIKKDVMLNLHTYVELHMLGKSSLEKLNNCGQAKYVVLRASWYLRWLIRTRADINLRQSGLARPTGDIKLWPNALVKTWTDTKFRN